MRFARSRVSVAVVATGVAALGAALFPLSAHAAGDTWVDYATVSMTDPNTQKLTANRLCYTDGRDLACDGAAGLLLTSGTLSIPNISATALTVNGVAITGSSSGDRITSGTASAIANSSSGYISLTTGATTWGYLGSSATYLPTLNVGGNVSASAISTTVAQIASRTVTSIAGGGGNYIVSGTTSVSTSSAGSIAFVTASSQRMVIDSSGKVGIGTATPAGSLDVNGDVYGRGNAVVGYVSGTSGGVYITKTSQYGAAAVQGVTSSFGTATLSLNPAGGNVGIGTMAPNVALEVNGSISATTVSATNVYGNGSNLTALNGSNISTGTISTSRLGSGTANSSTYLRGDGSWAIPSGGVTAQTTMTSTCSYVAGSGGCSTTTAACTSGYIRSGCSANITGAASNFAQAQSAPSGSTACTCSGYEPSGGTNGTVNCYTYCIK